MAQTKKEGAKLPTITNKFSSWTPKEQQSSLNELDDLLAEHEMLLASPNKKAGFLGAKNGVSKRQADTSSVPVCDDEEMDFDEVINEFGGGSSALKMMSRGDRLNNSSAKKKVVQALSGGEDIESTSFDLDNSDDLNKFINRYETMLDGKTTNSKKQDENTLQKQQASQIGTNTQHTSSSNTLAKPKDSQNSKKLQLTTMGGEFGTNKAGGVVQRSSTQVGTTSSEQPGSSLFSSTKTGQNNGNKNLNLNGLSLGSIVKHIAENSSATTENNNESGESSGNNTDKLEESWGSLQMQAEQMLSEDNNGKSAATTGQGDRGGSMRSGGSGSKTSSQSSAGLNKISPMKVSVTSSQIKTKTTSVEKEIEEEIIAEEIQLAQQAKFGSQMMVDQNSKQMANNKGKDAQSVIIDNKYEQRKGKGNQTKNSSLVEDFDSYSDDEDLELDLKSGSKNAKKGPSFGGKHSHKQRMKEIEIDEAFEEVIADEVGTGGCYEEPIEEEEDLKFVDEEIMNSASGKADVQKLKDLISKIDSVRGGTGGPPGDSKRSSKTGSQLSQGSQSSANSSSFKSKKVGQQSSGPVDQQIKFSSSSKVVISKHSSKGNLHDNAAESLLKGRTTPGSGLRTSQNQEVLGEMKEDLRKSMEQLYEDLEINESPPSDKLGSSSANQQRHQSDSKEEEEEQLRGELSGSNSEDDIEDFIQRHLLQASKDSAADNQKSTATSLNPLNSTSISPNGKGNGSSGEKKTKNGQSGEKEKSGGGKVGLASGSDSDQKTPAAPTEEEKEEMIEEPLSSDSDGTDEDYEDDGEKLTPKQTLLSGLIRLGDPKARKYSLTEREHFVFDLESILKVLTFKETVTFVFPVLDVYAAEQDYLKIELLRQIPAVFKKLMKSPARTSDQDALDLLTVNIFPLISQILMTSEENVQSEAVETLQKISDEFLPKEEATFLTFNVVQLLAKKSDVIENAKIAVLLLVQKFSESGYFLEKECTTFLDSYLDKYMKGAIFKIKKQAISCLLALSKPLPYEVFKKRILKLYLELTEDSIWGVRRTCMELLPEFLKQVKATETEILLKSLNFVQKSLQDESKWVRNQAHHQIGKVIYEVHLKAQENKDAQKTLTEKIAHLSASFLDQALIQGGLGSSMSSVSLALESEEARAAKMLSISTSNAKQDQIDKVKEMWAFNMPCLLMVNGGRPFWIAKAKPIYKLISKDILLSVRKSLAASLVEIGRLLNLKDEEAEEERSFLVDIANNLLSDVDEVKLNLLPNICDFISLFPEQSQAMLLSSMLRERLQNDKERKSRDVRVKLIQRLFQLFPTTQLIDNEFHHFLYEAIKSEQVVAHRIACAQTCGKFLIAKLIKNKTYRTDLTNFIDSLRRSKNFRDRQMYLIIAQATFEEDQEIYKKHFAKSIGNEMCDEKVTIVKIVLAKLASMVTPGYSKSTDKIVDHFKAQSNSEVSQFFSKENPSLDKRRYLEPDSIKTKLKAEEEEEEKKDDSDLEEETDVKAKKPTLKLVDKLGENDSKTNDQENQDEEEKMTAGEKQENQEIETSQKSVNIRLCNYSLLVRAQSFSSSGLSSQLMALLGGYGSLLMGMDGSEEAGGVPKKMLDGDEEKMLEQKKKEKDDEESKEQQRNNAAGEEEEYEDYDDETW